MLSKAMLSILLAAVVVIAGCVTGVNTESLTPYMSRLDPMMGGSPDDVIPAVTQELGFRLLSKWAGVNPTVETVVKKTPRQASFSKEEAEEIFREEGFYDVMVYVKTGDKAKSYYWDGDPEDQMTYHDHSLERRSFVLARLVFRDKKLHARKFFRVEIAS